MNYTATVEYETGYETCTYSLTRLVSPSDARAWILGHFTRLLNTWEEIDQNGITVNARVENKDEGYCDCYTLICN